MSERRALAYFGLFTILLLVAHFTLAVLLESVFLKFTLLSYAFLFGMSIFEIISLRVRYTVYAGLVPYVVLGMSIIKMLVSILWIFYAISKELISTSSVMIHFFVPYFLFLAFTAWIMIRMMR